MTVAASGPASCLPPLPAPDAAEVPTAPPRPAAVAGALSGVAAAGKVFDRVAERWIGPRPFADVSAALPAGKLVRVGDQLVHVEQAGRGEPVLLLHGFGCSSHSWRLVFPGLARRFRVLAPDLNGFGWTQRSRDAGAYTVEGQEAMLLGLLDRLGHQRVHLVGHSYGGGLGLWLAARHPERLRSLTLVASSLPEYSQQVRQAWARFRSLNWLLVHFFVLSRSALRRGLELSVHDRGLVTPELVEAYRERLLVEGVEDAYYGLMAPVDLPAPEVELERLEVPTLVVWGSHDAVMPYERAAVHIRRLRAAETLVLDGCGHMPMEERPRELLDRLLPFLERHREPWTGRLRGLLQRLRRAA